VATFTGQKYLSIKDPNYADGRKRIFTDEYLEFLDKNNLNTEGKPRTTIQGKITQNQIKEINKLIKTTKLNQSDIAEAVNKKFPEPKLEGFNVTHYAKKYFNIPSNGKLNKAYKDRFTFKDRKGKLIKDLVNNETLKEKITADYNNGMAKEEIRLKYRVGGAGAKFLPQGLKVIGKDTLNKVYDQWGLERENVRKIDVTTKESKNLAKKIKKLFNNPKLSREAALKQLGMSKGAFDKFEQRWDEANPNDPLFRKRESGEMFEGARQETIGYKNKTKQLQQFQSLLQKYQKNPPRSGTLELAKLIKLSGLSPVGFQQNIQMLRRIYKGQPRPGFKINETLKGNIGKFPISTALTGDILLEAGYTPKQIKKLNKAQDIIRYLERNKEVFLNQLEHKVPKALASELLNNKLINRTQYKALVGKIAPVTSFLNQWKKQYDLQRLINLQNYLSSPMEKSDVINFNRTENDIIKQTKTISGGYDIGRVKIDVDGNIDIQSPDEVFTSKVKGIGTGSRALIDYYKNLKYHNNIAKQFNKNKSNPFFGTLNAYTKGADVPIYSESITSEISKLNSSEDFTKWLSNNTNSSLFKGLTKLVDPVMRSKLLKAGKIGGTATLAMLIPTMLMAETPKEKGLSTAEVMARKNAVKEPTVTEPLKYDATQGSIVNANTDQKADQNQILEYVKDNPLKVTAGTSLGFAAQEVPGAYKAARDLGRGRIRSTLGISGALRPLLTTFGTPLMTGLYEGAIGSKRLEEGETMTDILTDPLGPALGVSLMEPLSKLSGVVKDAPKRTMLEGARNYFNLSNVGQARPGITGQILRMGMSPRMIAGASRFLGLPGVALGLGMAGYDAYKDYQNQEGMIYNLFNRDE